VFVDTIWFGLSAFPFTWSQNLCFLYSATNPIGSASFFLTSFDLITGDRRCYHITPVLRQLHWLPVRQRVEYKVACLVYQSLYARHITGEWHQPHGRQWLTFSPISFRQDMRCPTKHTKVSETDASVLRVRVYGTVCHPTCVRTSATNSLSNFWKHFYLGVSWPQRIVTILFIAP